MPQRADETTVLLIDADGVVTSCSLGLASRLGYTVSDVVPRKFTEFLQDLCADADANLWSAALAAASTEVETFDQVHVRCRDGRTLQVRVGLTRVRNATAATGQVVATLREVEQIHGAEAGFQALLEAAPDAMIIVNRAGEIVAANGQVEGVLGYDRSELKGKPIEVLVPRRFQRRHPGLRAEYGRSPHARPMGTGQLLSALRKDGTECAVEISLSPLQMGDETLTISAIRDVSERRVIEQRFRALWESAPDGLMISDSGGRIVLVNSEAKRMFGYEESELVGQLIEELVPVRFRARHHDYRMEYLKTPRLRPIVAGRVQFARRKDGAEFPVEISLSPIETDEGTVVMSAIRDITERCKTEARLQQIEELNSELEQSRATLLEQNRLLQTKNRELDEFAYCASHDLQEPLRKLISFGRLLPLDLGGDLPPKAADDLRYIVAAATRMKTLIEGLLELSRAGSSAMQLKRVEMDTCVDEAIDILETRIAETSAVIRRDPLGAVQGDPLLLTQLYQNLIGNALKFRLPGEAPQVHITAVASVSGTIYGVRDHGIGIKAEYVDRVFAPFKRLHGAEEYEGSGVGLAICRRVVERHCGRIWVESEPGVGSHFRFTLAGAVEDASWKAARVVQPSCC